jgi:hypothetical protein
VKTKARSVVLQIIILFVALGMPRDSLLARPNVTVTGAKLTEYGVYRRTSFYFEKAAKTPEGRIARVNEAKLLRKTRVIRAAMNVTFGIRFTVTGAPQNASVDLVVKLLHPKIVNPNTSATSVEDQCRQGASIGEPTYTDVNLDLPWDLVPGKWTFRVMYKSRVLLEVPFELKAAR